MKQMIENRLETCERVSALADGHLDAGQLNSALQNLADDAELRADWNAYHAIGEVLRNGERAAAGASAAFVDRLMAMSLVILHPVYATLYVVPFLRAVGVKIGHRAEVSTARGINYELTEIGDESFIADGVLVGDGEIRRNMV
ncbi:MAG: hypothetical protein EOP21_14850, partial [Hyphomicrobiales bacterium]